MDVFVLSYKAHVILTVVNTCTAQDTWSKSY